MARVYVSLDVETTGLSPERDQIIEVGAVRFRGSRILDEYQTFIKPTRAIPFQIQQLTGITNEMVADAPSVAQIAPQLKRFVGEHAIVGHNIGFDLGFLRKQGLFYQNIGVDTFEIASILLPYAGRYSLQALAHLLNIEDPPTHRALDDAKVTHQLFEALLDQARRLDGQVIKTVADMATRGEWGLATVFKDLSRERTGSTFASALGQQLSAKKTLFQDNAPITPLKPVSPPKSLDIDVLAAIIEPEGVFDKAFEQFEHRQQQVAMLRNVAQAFNEPYHLLVEAGTGTGKSLAYLIPAIYWALQNEMRVVVSTNTINLQDQIINKDIPDLQSTLKLDVRGVTLKGRGNYVCPWRVDQLHRRGNLSPAEMRLLAKVAIWLPNTVTGDRQELFMPNYEEQAQWNQINANSDICPPDRCAREDCFFHKAHQAAETAHLIVVNHALLLADISVNNRVIPEYGYLIIDEAHHLEDSVTKQLSFSANRKSMEQLLNDLGNARSGLLSVMQRQIKAASLKGPANDMSNIIDTSRQVLAQANQHWAALFTALENFMNQFAGAKRGNYDRQLRIASRMRVQPAWSDIELAWDNTNTILTDVINLVILAGKLWDGLDSYDVEDWELVMTSLTHYRTQLEEIKTQISLIISGEDNNAITWIQQKIKYDDLILHAVPLHVGDLVQKHLFDTKESIVMTSATLRTDNSFDYIQERLGAWDIGDLAVGSPFDYVNSTLVYIPTDIPEPNTPNFQRTFEQAIIDLAIATQGRMLVLFTAYSHLNTTATNTREALAAHDIVVFQQGQGMGRRQMMVSFKGADKAVLMGTRSFWEGVDIPGEDLSCVVIAKIPFAVPSDPIFQARSETFDSPFDEYSVPEAILHFRQGFGRLIRTRSDRGVVAILDRRVISKGYGRAFLDSLPETTLQQGPVGDLPAKAAAWINQPETD